MLIRTIAVVLAAMLIAARVFAAEEKIRITYANNSLTFLAAFIAKDRGFYARNGLTAELIQARPAVNIAALLSGDVDYVEVFGSAIRSAARRARPRLLEQHQSAVFQPRGPAVDQKRQGVERPRRRGRERRRHEPDQRPPAVPAFRIGPGQGDQVSGDRRGEVRRRGFQSQTRRRDSRRAAVFGHDETRRLSRARECRRHRRVSARSEEHTSELQSRLHL